MVRLWRRRPPDPLGSGEWRRAHDRFLRALDRFDQILAHVPENTPENVGDGTRDRLFAARERLSGLAPVVYDVSVRAQALAPSQGEIVPAGRDGRLIDVHRCLARAATLVAQSAESVTLVLVGLRARRFANAAAGAMAAERASSQAGDLVTRARAILDATGKEASYETGYAAGDATAGDAAAGEPDRRRRG